MPFRRSVALCLALALPLPGLAEEIEEAPVLEPGPATSAGGPLLHGKLELSLQDAIRMTLENNLNVQVERYSPIIAHLDEDVAWGAYDPTAFAEIGYNDQTTPNANALAGNTETRLRTTDGAGGFRGLLPWIGTEYEARYEGAKNSSNQAFASLSPEYTSGWNVSLTQPILRDLIWSQPWTQVQTNRILTKESTENFRRAVMDEIQSVEDAYWTLIANAEALRVAEKSKETAAALLDQTQTQYDVGVVSKVEVTEAEAGVAQRDVELIRALNTYRNQQDVLIDLVLGPNLSAESSLEIVPQDRPDDYTPYEIDVESAVSRAFQNRPEIIAALKAIERSEVQSAFARNQRLPELDGIFSVGQRGLSGQSSNRSFIPGGAFAPDQGGFRRSVDDYEDSPVYSGRARFSIPFPNTSAKSTESIRDLEMRRARTQHRRLRQQIVIEVRQAARNLEASQEGIEAAKKARIAAAEQLRAEEIRLEYGESTPFDVLQREEDLVDREQAEIDAFRSYRVSVTALDRAQGTILRSRNIKIADVSPLR
ncbi:MAG: TolC family protein [Myxococcota bacterium]